MSAVLLALGLLSIAVPVGATPPTASPAVAPSHPTIAGGYNPIPLTRVFNPASAGKLAPSTTRKVAVGGHGGIPTDAVAVEVNVTVQAPVKTGWLSVFAGTAAYKGIATVSFNAGVTEQRMITANLGTDGSLNLRDNLSGVSLSVILDVVGYYSGGAATQPGAYHPIPVQRMFDSSRNGVLKAFGTSSFLIGGYGAIPNADDGLTVVANVTIVRPNSSGYLYVDLGTEQQAEVDWYAGDVTQQMVSFRVNTVTQRDELLSQAPEAASVVIDVIGYFDSTNSTGAGGYVATAEHEIGFPTLEKQSTRTYPILSSGGRVDSYGVPTAGVWAVRLMIDPEPHQPADIGVSPTDEPATGASTIFAPVAHSLSYDVTVRVDASGNIRLTNTSIGRTVVAIRVMGYYAYGANPLRAGSVQNVLPATNFSLISCAAASFCLAGNGSGFTSIYDGNRWSRPNKVDAKSSLTDVTCPAVNDCFAVGSNLLHFDGTNWTAVLANPEPLGVGPRISCVGEDFCVASFAHHYATWNGSQWTVGDGVATGSSGGPILALSCASSTFCLALDGPAYYSVFDGHTWSTPTARPEVDTARPFLACPAVQHCVLLSAGNEAATFDGTTWSTTPLPAGGGVLRGMSCSSTTACVAVDTQGDARTFDGTSWSGPSTMADPGVPYGVTCLLATQRCVAISLQVGDFGDSYTATTQVFDGSSWAAPVTLTAGYGRITGLSCSNPASCTAVTSTGFAIHFDGDGWDLPTPVTHGPFIDVSCAGATCLAIQAGGVASYQGGDWSGLTQIDVGNNLTSVSCAADGRCVVGDDHGQVFSNAAGTWSGPHSVGTTAVRAVSCADGSCLAMLADGTSSEYGAGGWRSVSASPVLDAATLSCASGSYCEASDAKRTTAVFDGTTWSSVPGGYTSVVCVGVAQCQNYIATDGTTTFWDGHYRSLVDGGAFGDDRSRLACPTATMCLLSDGGPQIYRFWPLTS